MESTHAALRAQIHALEDEVKNHKTHISSLQLDNQKLQKNSSFLENELREAESLRRKLHNEVQELRGNIRVFCRVRPSVRNDSVNAAAQGAVDTALATMKFPNEREANQLELIATGESATGTATMSKHHFQFDRVFQPTATQADVFEEVAHLTQSVLDGYNVSPPFLVLMLQVLTCRKSCDRHPSSPTARPALVRHTLSKDLPTASCLARLAAPPLQRLV
jgi:kinesin family member C1